MSFTRDIQSQGTIYFARTRDEDGNDVHYFLRVEPAKEAAFLKAMRGREMLDYADYGEIVASGYGHVPSSQTLLRLKQEYDYEFSIPA